MKKHPNSRDVSGKKNPRYRPVWDRFWDKVDKSGDCWLWTGAKNSSGYGCIGVDGKIVQPHRFIMNAPDGVCVLHHCDTPLCVNPEHLYFGDRKQNAKDRDTRNRNGMQKLTNEEIRWIYQLDAPIEMIRCAFGITHAVVSRIKRGISYKHITNGSVRYFQRVKSDDGGCVRPWDGRPMFIEISEDEHNKATNRGLDRRS